MSELQQNISSLDNIDNINNIEGFNNNFNDYKEIDDYQNYQNYQNYPNYQDNQEIKRYPCGCPVGHCRCHRLNKRNIKSNLNKRECPFSMLKTLIKWVLVGLILFMLYKFIFDTNKSDIKYKLNYNAANYYPKNNNLSVGGYFDSITESSCKSCTDTKNYINLNIPILSEYTEY
jgi:hypothetical protein